MITESTADYPNNQEQAWVVFKSNPKKDQSESLLQRAHLAKKNRIYRITDENYF